jgi:uncharacterized alpha-E superfamily protein
MTSRIVDVRSAQLLPAETPELRPFETVQWMSVLKSLSGYQMYRLRMRTRVHRADVLEFLLRDDQFPRACKFCIGQVESALQSLPRSEVALALLNDLRRFLAGATLGTLSQPDMHELIDRLQQHINAVHGSLAQTYFPTAGIGNLQRQTSNLAAVS